MTSTIVSRTSMQLITFPVLLFAAAVAAGLFATPAHGQDGRPLVITAPRYADPAHARAYHETRRQRVNRVGAPDFAPDARRAIYETRATQRGHMGGGFLEFVFGGNRGYAELPRQPYHRAWNERDYDERYDARYDGRYLLAHREQPDVRAAVPRAHDPRFNRQIVDYVTDEKPGTIVIDTRQRFLYYVQEGGKAIRYGVGVGREGFGWTGTEKISQKREWPDWIPPKEMLRRRPDLPTFMAGGIDNPLGARALYLGSTLYRIHGSNEPWTIGQAVSSGCFRMKNEDVIDLYDRVGIGTKVVVI
jgi:lipoprotein-anchoring transpeptidase ErfK/SrfK